MRQYLEEAYQDLLKNLDNWYKTEQINMVIRPDDYEGCTREDYISFYVEGGWFADPLDPELIRRRREAEKRIAQQRLEDSWKANPDRMGGQFAPEEYEQLKRSEQGIFG